MIYYSERDIIVDPPIPQAGLEARAAADHQAETQHSGSEDRSTDPVSAAAAAPRYSQWGDEVSIGDLAFSIDPDHPDCPRATAIVAGDEGDGGRDLHTALEWIVTDFAHAADDTARTFADYLEYEDGHDGLFTRVYVRDGTTVTEGPELVWPQHPPGQPTGIPADPTASAYPAQAPATEVDTTDAAAASAAAHHPEGAAR